MDVPHAHKGPLPLPEGVSFTQALSDRIFRETGVRATYRSRKQWGTDMFLIRAGPYEHLEKAWTLVIRYGTAAGGGAGGGGSMAAPRRRWLLDLGPPPP